MDDQEVIRLYVDEKKTLRHIARVFFTDHHKIKRRLEKYGIQIDSGRPSTEPFTEGHKRKIGEKSKGRKSWSRGLKMSLLSRYKNMQVHLRFDVPLDWLRQFEDIDKLIFLNKALSRKRDGGKFTTETYQAFIARFYTDEQFNAIYAKWIKNGKGKYLRPSLDHVVPKSKGGGFGIDNLQFLTWFENRCKNDMSIQEWNSIKKNISEYFI